MSPMIPKALRALFTSRQRRERATTNGHENLLPLLAATTAQRAPIGRPRSASVWLT